MKTQLTVNSKGLIVHRTKHARGRRHDYAIFKESHPELPNGVRPGVDLGYDGIQNDYPEMKPIIPFKRRSPGRGHRDAKGSGLTHSQKRFNKKLSKARMIVEHTISRMKKFRVMGEEFRNRLKRYDVMTDIVSIGTRQLQDTGNNSNYLRGVERKIARESALRCVITTKVYYNI